MADKFYGVAIWDNLNPDTPYYTEVEVNQDLKHNFKAIVQEPVNQKLPTVIYPSATNYLSGSAKGNFADNSECEVDYSHGVQTEWRLHFTEWLTNFHTKYLKLSDSLIIPVAIVPDVSWEVENTVDDGFAKVSFNWVQVGKIARIGDKQVECSNCRATLSPTANYCWACGQGVSK